MCNGLGHCGALLGPSSPGIETDDVHLVEVVGMYDAADTSIRCDESGIENVPIPHNGDDGARIKLSGRCEWSHRYQVSIGSPSDRSRAWVQVEHGADHMTPTDEIVTQRRVRIHPDRATPNKNLLVSNGICYSAPPFSLS